MELGSEVSKLFFAEMMVRFTRLPIVLGRLVMPL